MQINGINTSQVVPVVKAIPPQTTNPAVANNTDRAEFNLSAHSFSSLVHQASQMPEVRTELVDAFKARIQAGHYPAQDIVDGLIRLVGGGIVQAAKAGSSSGNK